MSKRQKVFSSEKGAVTIEFLGILPYFFLFFLLLWQVVGSGYAVVTARSAVNEAAKAYAMTESTAEAAQAAQNIIGNSDNLRYKSIQIISQSSDGDFKIQLETRHGLVFIPKQWRIATSIGFTQTAGSRVIE